MHEDPCFRIPDIHGAELDPETALQFLVKFTGVIKRTPAEYIDRAIAEEIDDLDDRAARALREAVDRDRLTGVDAALADKALGALTLARAASSAACSGGSPRAAYFPRGQLSSLLEARGEGASNVVTRTIEAFIEQHRAFETRLGWLLGGTRADQIAKLDPITDCDRIMHAVSSAFRVENRVLETIVVNRIAQSTSVSLFFRSTREAEDNPIGRFYDTFILLANFFEWGEHSRRGRETVRRMNQIHGRYYVPNAGMKYVLLQTAFTWIDGVDRIGHRPLLDVERRAYLHGFVKLGRAMNIADITDDYDAMYAWYRQFNAANAEHAPLKTDTFETIVDNSLMPVASEDMRRAMHIAARVAMDDTYRAALGYVAPTDGETAAVRSVMFTLGRLVAALPPAPFVRSLQRNPARTAYMRAGELGVSSRSPSMPVVDPARPNGGYPEDQRPIAAESEIAPMDLPVLDWSEIRRHDSEQSLWVVIDGYVYDLTSWAALHPGGLRVLQKVAGRDASGEFHRAKHSAATQIFKLNYRIGRVAMPEPTRHVAPGEAARARPETVE